MIKKILEAKKTQKYYQSMENINHGIFSNNQRKLWAIMIARDFTDVEDLHDAVMQSQEAIEYFIALHNENIQRYEALKNQNTSKYDVE